MNRALPMACCLLLAGLLGWQLLDVAEPAPAIERVPVFTPLSIGHPVDGASCPGATDDPDLAPLQRLPLGALAAELGGPGRMPSDAQRQALDRAAALQRQLRELRNRRHAGNVEAMELVSAIALELEPAQLDWILDNRDRVAAGQLDAPPPLRPD